MLFNYTKENIIQNMQDNIIRNHWCYNIFIFSFKFYEVIEYVLMLSCKMKEYSLNMVESIAQNK